MNSTGLFDVILSEEDNKYTSKVSIPQYLPSAECPNIHDLVGMKKYNELMTEIETSNVSEEQKEFLRQAATRHLVFNYAKVADYYAHQGNEMQKLMEKSALVLIDFDDAIANGYAKLDHRIIDLAMEQYSVREKLGKEE